MTLYVMLVGAYPFEDPADPRNFRKTIQVFFGVLRYSVQLLPSLYGRVCA